MGVAIYKISSPSKSIYIGQSREIENRMRKYNSMACFLQKKLYNSLLKHGIKSHSFKIVHELPEDIPQETLNLYETLYYESYKDLGFNMMNIKEPGSNGKHSPETIIKIKEKAKLRGNNGVSRIGLKHSDETKLKLGLLAKNRICSIETKLKMSLSGKGRKFSESTRKKMSLSAIGKSSALKGRPISDTHKANIGKANKGRNQYTLRNK